MILLTPFEKALNTNTQHSITYKNHFAISTVNVYNNLTKSKGERVYYAKN